MRMRKKKNLVPRMERCADRLIQDPFSRKGQWDSEELWVELGCGKGGFSVATAQANPQVLYIGIEKIADAMVVGMERAVAEKAENLFFINSDAALLPEFFQKGEVTRIFVNFCDPWPSKRHAKRRLTAPGFLELYKQVLRPGGEVHFKTDNAELFDYSLVSFEENGFSLHEVTHDLHAQGIQGIMTDYESKFVIEGREICRCVARLEEA